VILQLKLYNLEFKSFDLVFGFWFCIFSLSFICFFWPFSR